MGWCPFTLQFLRDCNDFFVIVGEGTRTTDSKLFAVPAEVSRDSARRCRLPCDGHIPQFRDAIGERRMGAEQARKYLAGRKRCDDAKRRRGRGNIHRNFLVIGAEFF